MKITDLNTYDWEEAFKFSDGQNLDFLGDNNQKNHIPFKISDIKKIISVSEGYNDGDNWIIFVKLKNGYYGFLSAGCDYTGWDCQASGFSYVSKSKKKIIRYGMGEDDRKRLGLTLIGEDFSCDSKRDEK